MDLGNNEEINTKQTQFQSSATRTTSTETTTATTVATTATGTTHSEAQPTASQNSRTMEFEPSFGRDFPFFSTSLSSQTTPYPLQAHQDLFNNMFENIGKFDPTDQIALDLSPLLMNSNHPTAEKAPSWSQPLSNSLTRNLSLTSFPMDGFASASPGLATVPSKDEKKNRQGGGTTTNWFAMYDSAFSTPQEAPTPDKQGSSQSESSTVDGDKKPAAVPKQDVTGDTTKQKPPVVDVLVSSCRIEASSGGAARQQEAVPQNTTTAPGTKSNSPNRDMMFDIATVNNSLTRFSPDVSQSSLLENFLTSSSFGRSITSFDSNMTTERMDATIGLRMTGTTEFAATASITISVKQEDNSHVAMDSSSASVVEDRSSIPQTKKQSSSSSSSSSSMRGDGPGTQLHKDTASAPEPNLSSIRPSRAVGEVQTRTRVPTKPLTLNGAVVTMSSSNSMNIGSEQAISDSFGSRVPPLRSPVLLATSAAPRPASPPPYPYQHVEQQKKKPRKSLPANKLYIEGEPLEFDVLCGRGSRSNYHKGNQAYLQKIQELQPRYKACGVKSEKTQIAQNVVDYVNNERKGRFLVLDKKLNRWFIVPNSVARTKAGQALRDTNTEEARKARREKYGH